jgi:tRNA nucleotidyltransferase (CCA-adding enzyme)
MQAIAEFLAASPVPELRAETLMTRAIRTIPVDATIAQATAAQIRSGHQALPVIDANRVVHGLIGQRDLDLAMRHELGEALLANYMWRRPRLVAPETPLDELRRALLNDEGRSNACLLVVDAQQHLLGIITRADLLRAWAATQPHEEPHTDTSAVLERFLPAAIINILRQAAAQAEQRNEQLYLVGGAVRDMLLDRQPGDLDLVVEGDAIGLAEALAERLAGRVRSYLPFRTATLAIDLPTGMPIMLDFVTARKEFYQQPAALPEVDPASLRHDLHRRDFTINTLAICLNPSRYGRLYDFYGGQQDLQQRLVRVLHNLSFIDDPTRILRAARLAARLGCTIEPRTRALITDAVKRNLIGRTTPQRILTELLLVLAEPEPEHALALMDELAILPAICPSLIYSPDLPIWFQAARQLTLSPDQLVTLNLALLAYSSTPTLRARCITRYRLPTQQAQVLQDLGATQKAVPLLTEQNLPNSQIDRLLHDLHPIALTAAQIAEPSAAHAIQRYQTLLHSIQLDINGDDLRALGLTPGPHFRRLLNDLRAARLDGIVATREEQLDWIRQHA